MAKMFYSIEETAEKLGVSVEEIAEMAASGKLQQFRDRDKIMFKVDQVDRLVPASSDDLSSMDTDVDSVNLSSVEDPGDSASSATGISVFDVAEADDDPMAQTVVSGAIGSDDEELALESIGSGSGLLDLTRESDDTSLGAELLEEVSLVSGSDAKMDMVGTGGFDNIFDGAGGAASAPVGGVSEFADGLDAESAASPMAFIEPSDAAGNGLLAGLLIGAIAAIVIGLFVVVPAMGGVKTGLASAFVENFAAYAGGLAGGTIVLGVIGMFVGKAMGGK